MTGRYGFGGMSASRRAFMRALTFGLVGMRCGAVVAHPPTESEMTSTTESSRADHAAVFPLAVEPGKRYLVDAAGTLFLIHGDTAWSLIAQLTREDVDFYLHDRHARGFNAILVSLIENHYSSNPPANAYGQRPFEDLQLGGSGAVADYTAPNEAYFAYADWVLRRAAAKGILVLLTPSYVGCCSDGWYDAMVANGADRLQRYGEYLGRRYRDFTNILWVHGGDANPPEKDLVRAIAEGIRRFDSRSLHTAHAAPWTPALDYWAGEPWLQVNTAYTAHPDAWSDNPVYADALEEYARPERMPFFLIEGVYENSRGVSERHLRTQAYQALLSGAAGQVFGNSPIWYFDMPGYDPLPVTWKEALGSRGAQSMTHLRDLLMPIPWWLLKPDTNHTLLTDGLGPEEERAVAARTADGSLAIFYLPGSREVTIDLEQLAGPRVVASWYDPADGRFSAVVGSPFPATEPQQFRPKPGNNSSGFDDWVLILESLS
ncbi:MAG: DUF4038 domain-containing protein [Geminicoccaceae bacterium]